MPEITHPHAFMPVLVPSNFDDDSIETEQAHIGTPFSHYTAMRYCLDTQWQLALKSVVGSDQNSFKVLCMSVLPASLKTIGSIEPEKCEDINVKTLKDSLLST